MKRLVRYVGLCHNELHILCGAENLLTLWGRYGAECKYDLHAVVALGFQDFGLGHSKIRPDGEEV